VVVTLKNVAEGDATDLAQQIWDQHSEEYDAARGEFDVHISQNGFAVDWTPDDSA
jgi:hypothetical protein